MEQNRGTGGRSTKESGTSTTMAGEDYHDGGEWRSTTETTGGQSGATTFNSRDDKKPPSNNNRNNHKRNKQEKRDLQQLNVNDQKSPNIQGGGAWRDDNQNNQRQQSSEGPSGSTTGYEMHYNKFNTSPPRNSSNYNHATPPTILQEAPHLRGLSGSSVTERESSSSMSVPHTNKKNRNKGRGYNSYNDRGGTPPDGGDTGSQSLNGNQKYGNQQQRKSQLMSGSTFATSTNSTTSTSSSRFASQEHWGRSDYQSVRHSNQKSGSGHQRGSSHLGGNDSFNRQYSGNSGGTAGGYSNNYNNYNYSNTSGGGGSASTNNRGSGTNNGSWYNNGASASGASSSGKGSWYNKGGGGKQDQNGQHYAATGSRGGLPTGSSSASSNSRGSISVVTSSSPANGHLTVTPGGSTGSMGGANNYGNNENGGDHRRHQEVLLQQHLSQQQQTPTGSAGGPQSMMNLNSPAASLLSAGGVGGPPGGAMMNGAGLGGTIVQPPGGAAGAPVNLVDGLRQLGAACPPGAPGTPASGALPSNMLNANGGQAGVVNSSSLMNMMLQGTPTANGGPGGLPQQLQNLPGAGGTGGGGLLPGQGQQPSLNLNSLTQLLNYGFPPPINCQQSHGGMFNGAGGQQQLPAGRGGAAGILVPPGGIQPQPVPGGAGGPGSMFPGGGAGAALGIGNGMVNNSSGASSSGTTNIPGGGGSSGAAFPKMGPGLNGIGGVQPGGIPGGLSPELAALLSQAQAQQLVQQNGNNMMSNLMNANGMNQMNNNGGTILNNMQLQQNSLGLGGNLLNLPGAFGGGGTGGPSINNLSANLATLLNGAAAAQAQQAASTAGAAFLSAQERTLLGAQLSADAQEFLPSPAPRPSGSPIDNDNAAIGPQPGQPIFAGLTAAKSRRTLADVVNNFRSSCGNESELGAPLAWSGEDPGMSCRQILGEATEESLAATAQLVKTLNHLPPNAAVLPGGGVAPQNPTYNISMQLLNTLLNNGAQQRGDGTAASVSDGAGGAPGGPGASSTSSLLGSGLAPSSGTPPLLPMNNLNLIMNSMSLSANPLGDPLQQQLNAQNLAIQQLLSNLGNNNLGNMNNMNNNLGAGLGNSNLGNNNLLGTPNMNPGGGGDVGGAAFLGMNQAQSTINVQQSTSGPTSNSLQIPGAQIVPEQQQDTSTLPPNMQVQQLLQQLQAAQTGATMQPNFPPRQQSSVTSTGSTSNVVASTPASRGEDQRNDDTAKLVAG